MSDNHEATIEAAYIGVAGAVLVAIVGGIFTIASAGSDDSKGDPGHDSSPPVVSTPAVVPSTPAVLPSTVVPTSLPVTSAPTSGIHGR
jgi:hypothetical protein